MEKYGYVPKDYKVKLAEERKTNKCPICGKDTSGNPPTCPEHGSKPFEKINAKDEK